VQTSLYVSGEQWDSPNLWAPLQHILVLGLRRNGTARACRLAAEITRRFLAAVFAEWQVTGDLHEKYHKDGTAGSGGEYAPQVGFGWTNGVALHLIEMYGFPHTGQACLAKDKAGHPYFIEMYGVSPRASKDKGFESPAGVTVGPFRQLPSRFSR
jgi:hypothetical protein